MPKCKRCLKTIEWDKVGSHWKAWDPEKNCWHFEVCGKKEPKRRQLTEIEKLRQMRNSFELRNSEDGFSKE